MLAQNIHILPNGRLPRGAANDPDGPTIQFRSVAVMLGVSRKGAPYQLGYVRALIESQGFPVPLPHFNHARNTLLTGIAALRPTARWQKAAIDAWFAGLLPPGARAMAAASEAAIVDATIAARLANMGGAA